jgi:excisionase family DNA binding protein
VSTGNPTASDDVSLTDSISEILKNIPPKTPFKSRTVSVEQAGEILGVSRMAAYKGIWSGDIPHIRIGRRIRVPLAKLNELVPPVEDDDETEATQPREAADDRPASAA